jgi:hypothetical protein
MPILCSTMLLLVFTSLGICRGILYPKRIWLGNSPVVWFYLLLWTADAVVSHWSQSSGAAEVTSWRYCSTHWFFHSDKPSVCGWNAVDKFCWMPSLAANAHLK